MPKRILITGANRGVGLALVHLLAKTAEHVYAGCRQPESAETLQQLARSSDNVSVIGLDVTDTESLKQASSVVEEGIDLLVCKAQFELPFHLLQECPSMGIHLSYSIFYSLMNYEVPSKLHYLEVHHIHCMVSDYLH